MRQKCIEQDQRELSEIHENYVYQKLLCISKLSA